MNGAQGEQGMQGIQGVPGKDGHTPVITIGENGNWYIDGVDSCVKAQGVQGEQGLSAYEIYLKYHPEYSGSEKQWIHDFISGRLETDIWYIVSFDSNGGTEVEEQMIMEGRKALMPEDPIREGYIFEGWYYKGEKWSFIGYDVTDDIELIAKWQEIYTEGLLFITLEDGTYGVSTSYTKFYKEVTIPSYYHGVKVTTIFGEGFKDCKELHTVNLPSTITRIENSAFSGCTKLTNITLNNEIEYIGSNAFSGCTLLKEVNLPNTLTYLGEYAFSGCTSLQSLSIGTGLNSIPKYAFNECKNLTTIYIPANVNSIGEYAFYKCSSITNVTIEGSSKWSASNTTFYKATMIDSYTNSFSYSTTEIYKSGENNRKTVNVTVSSASSFINAFVSGHSNVLFYEVGTSPYDYFLWYYMQNWTRE